MTIISHSPEEYIDLIDDPSKKDAIIRLRQAISASLPLGFEEGIQYNMICYVVPFSTYPAGYHCDPKLPLPFLSLAAQKNFVAVYHMGIYSDPTLLDWFVSEHARRVSGKLDMGKSCIRYKHPDKIPYDLIGELAAKMTPQQWIAMYESLYKKGNR
jgi:hypothetical protein